MIGKMLVNPLNQWHEAGSEVLFAPLNLARATLSSVVDEFRASSRPVAVL